MTLHDLSCKKREVSPGTRPHERSMHTGEHKVTERSSRSASPQRSHHYLLFLERFPTSPWERRHG